MTRLLEIAFGIVALFVCGALLIRSVRRSDDPPRLIVQWIVTFLIVAAGVRITRGMPPAVLMPVVALFALMIAILWARSLISALFKPFFGIFDGGDEEPVATPIYSPAEAKRKRGLFEEAIRELRKQMEKFPNDFTATMMIAAIQAEDLHDLPGAEMTVEGLLAIPGHPPSSVVGALHLLADWHLRFAQDPGAACAALEQIIALFPDTHWSQIAAQRIARLPTADELLGLRSSAPIKLPAGQNNVGLHPGFMIEDPEADAEAEAASCVEQLERFPLDSEVREKLAMIYAEKFHRYDLAEDQLEQLIAQPNESARRITHWLHLLATIHIRNGNLIQAQGALHRIIERYPGLAAAEVANTRLNMLRLELKRNEKSRSVALVAYERDLGLKNVGEKSDRGGEDLT